MSLRSAADRTISFSPIDPPELHDAGGSPRLDVVTGPDLIRTGAPPASEGSSPLTPGPACREVAEVSPRLVAGAARIGASRFKRGLDLAFAVAGLIFMSPFLLLLALIIRIETPGPALFKQRRTGLNGRTFVIYKFRTMRVVEDGGEIVQASANDTRTTGFGRFLRRSSIDELPQLLNVLKGEMSLIGPRPHALAHDAFYADVIPTYEARFLVRPGLSGLAQVRGCRGATPVPEMMAERVRWDLAYIETWSVGLELRIFFDTVRVFFFHPAPF